MSIIEKSILSAAKAYYLASLIETDGITIKKCSSRQLERMKDWLFKDYEYTKLNKLKRGVLLLVSGNTWMMYGSMGFKQALDNHASIYIECCKIYLSDNFALNIFFYGYYYYFPNLYSKDDLNLFSCEDISERRRY